MRLEILQDTEPMNPRTECDNLGTIYSSWTEKPFSEIDQGSRDETEAWLDANCYIWDTVYGYEHGGRTVSTSPFSCRWDSGLLGYIAVHKDKVRSEFGWKRITKAREQQILTYLEGEVETLAQYLEGDIYGYQVTDDEGNIIDSCWGYYGREAAEQEGELAIKHLKQK